MRHHHVEAHAVGDRPARLLGEDARGVEPGSNPERASWSGQFARALGATVIPLEAAGGSTARRRTARRCVREAAAETAACLVIR
jgi:hypothetical protein